MNQSTSQLQPFALALRTAEVVKVVNGILRINLRYVNEGRNYCQLQVTTQLD